MRRLLAFLAPLLLACPLLADGSVYLAGHQTQVNLDTPPAGYTRLEVQVTYLPDLTYGHENRLPDPQHCETRWDYGVGIFDGATPIHTDRRSVWLIDDFPAYDGAADGAGPSGRTERLDVRHALPAVVYGATPSTLTLRRGAWYTTTPAITSVFSELTIPARVTWRWLP